MEPYTKKIPCPEHGDHEATLYCWGHKYAGIWECDVTGESDSHEHTDYEVEHHEPPPLYPDQQFVYAHDVYICGGENGCGVMIDSDVADPERDRAEAIAERSMDCD